ncbi:NAD(P)-binding protein [Hypoxylon cercidicola]|nr:NAD(P)-binding protein [Hypoxylon cercidicola]
MTDLSEQEGIRETASRLAVRYSEAIKGIVILTTGVSPGGLGAAFVNAIAPMRPAMLILAGLDSKETQQTAEQISKSSPEVKIRTLEIDLSSLAAVRAAAETVKGWTDVPHIDLLVNNAGISAIPWTITEEGFEKHFATNYLGPFLFTHLIMPRILASEDPRIVNVGSDGHILSPVRFDDPNFRDESLYHAWMAYGQSKTAQMLTTMSLAEKLGTKHNLHAFSVHPGAVNTNLVAHLDWEQGYEEMSRTYRLLGHAQGWKKNFDFLTPDEGAATYVYAAFDDDIRAHNGAYLLKCHLGDPWKDDLRAWATSAVEAEMLWKLTETLIGQEFRY